MAVGTYCVTRRAVGLFHGIESRRIDPQLDAENRLQQQAPGDDVEEFSRIRISMIRPPTAAATCTTSASIEASLEEGCLRTQDADRRATTTASTMTPSAIRLLREVSRRFPWAFMVSPEEYHPGEQGHDNPHGRTDGQLQGDRIAEPRSRENDSGAERTDNANQPAQHPGQEERTE